MNFYISLSCNFTFLYRFNSQFKLIVTTCAVIMIWFSRHKHSEKWPEVLLETPGFAGTNTAGDVLFAPQKYLGFAGNSPEVFLEISSG